MRTENCRAQNFLHIIHRQITHQLAVAGNGNRTGFLADNKNHRIGLLGHTDCGTMAGTKLLAQITVFRKRQQAAGSNNAVAADNDSARHAAVYP